MTLSRPDVVPPRRPAPARASRRPRRPSVSAYRPLVLDPRDVAPGVDLERPPPRPARPERCTTAGPGCTPPTAASSSSATSDRWRRRKVVKPPGHRRRAAGSPAGRARRRPRREGAPRRRRQGDPARHRARAGRAAWRPSTCWSSRARRRSTRRPCTRPWPAAYRSSPSTAARPPTSSGHEHNGLLVGTDRGGKAFARAVARLAASPDLRFTLAANARASVPHRTWDDAVHELARRALPRRRATSPTAAIS